MGVMTIKSFRKALSVAGADTQNYFTKGDKYSRYPWNAHAKRRIRLSSSNLR